MSGSIRTLSPPVHPHVRGEDVARVELGGLVTRFTPTCVGKMVFQSSEYYDETGSPPRAWGRCLLTALGGGIARFTPTCVGKIPWRCTVLPLDAVHPHVRGEDGESVTA